MLKPNNSSREYSDYYATHSADSCERWLPHFLSVDEKFRYERVIELDDQLVGTLTFSFVSLPHGFTLIIHNCYVEEQLCGQGIFSNEVLDELEKFSVPIALDSAGRELSWVKQSSLANRVIVV